MLSVNVINNTEKDVIVMDDIFIPGTKQTPEISCKKNSGEVIFKGNFISSNPGELIEPIQQWLYSFISHKKAAALTLAFHLTYLNGSSGKSLCKLFQQAEEFQSKGLNIKVEFFCEDDDIDMLDWCKEMKESYHLPFSLSRVN